MRDSRFGARCKAALLAAALAAFGCSTPDNRTEQERAADRILAERVLAALQADPYAYAEHVTIDAKRGVVRLSGQVGDDSQLRDVLRISSAVPGVRRVDDQLEIIDFGRAGSRR
jgi:osmotically-inducible protein OsmY